MTVNYTTLLALGQPVTGTESGTWGDDVNNAVTSYLDIAIAGTLSLTSASFTANALTLANTQGTSSATNIGATTAQYMVLKVSSLAANVTITAPSSSKLYLVDNIDPTYTVTIKASGQTGYTVPVSTRALVYYNGTDYVLASSNNRNALINTLATTNGGTGLTSFTSGGAVYATSTSALTTGTLPVASGGTNATATPTAGAIAYGTGTAYAFTAAGTSGQVLQSNGAGAPTWANAATGDVTAAGNNAFTGANTFYNATGQTFGRTATQDGILLTGRNGGSSSYRVTFTPTTLTANRTLTLPDASGTVATVGNAIAFSIVFGL